MYTTQDTAKNPIRLFSFPNTLAGDAAVTIIIQCLLTWFVEWGLVAYDLSNRSVQPIGFLPLPTSPLARWFFFLPPAAAAEDPESASPSASGTGPSAAPAPTSLAAATTLSARLLLVIQQALRAMAICVPAFLVVWPVAVGAMTAAGRPLANHDYLYDDRWAPQVFKLLLGGVLSLLTTPLMAMYWLVRAGWAADAAAA